MLLREWKKKKRYTYKDLSWIFGKPVPTIKYWLSNGYKIRGPQNSKEVYLERVVATEIPIEERADD